VISSHTSFFYLFGNPVKHSISPKIHNYSFRHYGIDAVYMAIAVDEIKTALDSVRDRNISGANITIPFKTEAVKYVDEIDALSDIAGAVNTVSNENGILRGYNTDIKGIENTLLKLDENYAGKVVSIIGSGGAARAAVASLLLSNAGRVNIYARNEAKAQAMVDDIINRYGRHEKRKDFEIHVSSLNCKISGDILINATSVGLKAGDFISEVIENLDVFSSVMDMIYGKTYLLEKAEEYGIKNTDGINMLIVQAAESFRIWTGIYPEDVMRSAMI